MMDKQQATGNGLGYKQAGVDIDAGNRLVEAIKPLAAATRRPGARADLGGFGGVFDLKACRFTDPVLVAANDGVGTKLKVAIETGCHGTVGIDLVAMCVNDLLAQGAEPLFFLDYFACGQLDVDQAKTVIAGIADGCRQAGAALIGGESAEMPGLYREGDYDLAGFAVGAVERGELLPKAAIKSGDALIGLLSSGPHSNGYSLIRKIVAVSGADYTAPAPFDASSTLAEALLAPTRIYVKPVLAALRRFDGIKAMAHITGGGLIENVPRVLPAHAAARIDLDAVAPPAVFQWLRATGGVGERDMLTTFNCGVGMVLIADQQCADDVIAMMAGDDVAAVRLGEIALRQDGAEPVTFSGTIAWS